MKNFLVEYSDGGYEVLCSDDVVDQTFNNPNCKVIHATDWRCVIENDLPDKAIEAIREFEEEFYFCDGCMQIVDLYDCKEVEEVYRSPCCDENVCTRKNGRWTDDFK